MNNFVKKLWFKALLYRKCWLCAVQKQGVGSCLALLILLLLIGCFPAMGIVLLFMLGIILYQIITPKKVIKMKVIDRVLVVLVYDSDYHKPFINDYRHKSSFIRIIQKDANGTCEVINDGTEILSIDDRLCNSGFLLFKPTISGWYVICSGYENGYFLGNKIDDYIFINFENDENLRMFFIHGERLHDIEIASYVSDVQAFYDYDAASYLKFAPNGNIVPTENTVAEKLGKHLVFTDDCGQIKLLKYGMRAHGVPVVYLVAAPSITLIIKNKAISYTTNSDGTLIEKK